MLYPKPESTPLPILFLQMTQKMKLNILCLSLLGFLPYATNAQDTRDTLLPIVSYDKPAEFEIGGIRVTGAQYADANTLIAISGFRVGDKIRVPGSMFSKAVQSLWALKLFTDVQVNQERTVGDKIFLESSPTFFSFPAGRREICVDTW